MTACSMSCSENIHVLLFTRYPKAGEAKTRLIPALGAEKAAQLQKSMTEFTLKQIQRAFSHAFVTICYTGADIHSMQGWLGEDVHYFEQGQGHLGQRLDRAVNQAFALGACKVLVLGADCPENRAENLQEAAQLLDTNSCVIGPAHDGGYYLLALSRPMPSLFVDIAWGTETVLADTLAKLSDYALLPALHDVDYVQDIPTQISVIIPSYNEERHIAKAIESAQQGFGIEVLVADGGSKDDTCRIAQSLGAQVISCGPQSESQRGRAWQMNAAASVAQGGIVLFLHADSLLPQGWDVAVRQALRARDMSLGYFRFAVTGEFLGKNLLTWGTRLRAKYLHRPYGDQGLFLRKQDFVSLGGFASVPLLEDILLVKQAAKRGKVVEVPLALLTSGRRWEKYGFLKVTLLNQMVLLAAAMGMNVHKLASMYRAGSLRALVQHRKNLV